MKATLLVCSALAAVSAVASTRTDIERQYKRWAHAAVRNDVDTILAILTPDYTLTTFSGTVILRNDYETSLRQKKASGKPATAYETHLVSVDVQGATAKVISDETSRTLSVDPITRKKVNLIHVHRYVDTWVKGTTWRLRSTVTQRESTTIGK